MNQERQDRILAVLNSDFKPTNIELIDDSHHHIGHAGAATGLSHYTLKIASDTFEGLSIIQKHRMIYDALGDLMETDIHALRIVILP